MIRSIHNHWALIFDIAKVGIGMIALVYMARILGMMR